jgi:hypothetical protein
MMRTANETGASSATMIRLVLRVISTFMLPPYRNPP